MHCIDWINSELTMLVGSANVVCLLWVVVHLQHSIFGDTPYLLQSTFNATGVQLGKYSDTDEK
jgi:hypothetical protein